MEVSAKVSFRLIAATKLAHLRSIRARVRQLAPGLVYLSCEMPAKPFIDVDARSDITRAQTSAWTRRITS